jgi:hypothetical protein
MKVRYQQVADVAMRVECLDERSVVPARPVKVISYVCAGTTATPFASAGS